MIDKKKLDIVKKIIKLECTLHLFDEKKLPNLLLNKKYNIILIMNLKMM